MSIAFTVPELDRFKGSDLSFHALLQLRMVAGFLAHMDHHGWKVTHVHDGEELCPVQDAKSAMELIFDLDISDLTFENAQGKTHGVRLIPSNGEDFVGDWTLAPEDADGFNQVVSDFKPKQTLK